MPRPKTQSPTCLECDGSPTVARSLCQKCYDRAYHRGAFKPKGPVEVVADYAYPDPLGAQGGQTLVIYTCPYCGRQHIVSWLPIDPDPGLKIGHCRKPAARGGDLPHVVVLKPPEERILDAPPDDLVPRQPRAPQKVHTCEPEVQVA